MKKWLWIILIASMILTTPLIIERSQAEWNNDNYEITVPYHEMDQLIRGGAKQERLFKGLRKAGVTSVSLMPETIDSLDKSGKILVLEQEEIIPLVMSDSENKGLNAVKDKDGLYISDIDSSIKLKENLLKVFEDRVEEVTIGGRTFFFIEGSPEIIEDLFLSYSQKQIDLIKKYDYSIVLRIPVDEIVETNKHIWDQAFDTTTASNKVLFYGSEALGYKDEDYKKWADQLKEQNISLLTIEQYSQKGLETLANLNDLNVIRLRSFDLEKKPYEEITEEAIRAVKERNIRVLYIHLLTFGNAEKLAEENMEFFNHLNDSMPDRFKNEEATTFPKLDHSIWEMAIVLLGATIFIMLSVGQFLKKRWMVLAGAGTVLLAVIYFISEIELIIKLVALGVASLTPIFAALSYNKVDSWRAVLFQYLKAGLISFIGIWFVVSLLYGTEYFLHVGEGFRGVKVLYLMPIVVTVVYVIGAVYKRTKRNIQLGDVVSLLDRPIKYWHLLILVVVGAVLLYYVSRTGNAGSVSTLELTVRQKLEELLFVRPRTKEVLIGFPFYILGLYLFMRNYLKLGLLCMIPSIIGWLSLVNTFTHLHIPLYISLLRSIYSLSFGIVIGLLFIGVFNLGNRYFSKWKARW
ncbi:DUF5693 family protein [Pseudalkalibacillus berkeleyi]|uniref:DUF5693 family protein n=1 Tax=Pseudalkalibacillus berkeleyi TaxID=1069813 RepID=A0ABS9H191_9BACL|nr:DUF5693 family protein [Pseudalkalibacillus berkeleyi]MCF6138769.1 DUF5693 family protein [Pseudalkalibacillus berkeleyi]